MYKITLNLPNLSQGALVELDGLGIFKNGEEHLVEKDQADSFRQRGSSAHSVYDEKGRWQGEVFTVGPSLIEAFKDRPGVTVEVYHAPPPEESPKPKAETTKTKAKTEDKGGDS